MSLDYEKLNENQFENLLSGMCDDIIFGMGQTSPSGRHHLGNTHSKNTSTLRNKAVVSLILYLG